MKPSRLTLVRREDVAFGTTAFYFEKPAGFAFRAGQYMDFALIDPPETDAEGTMRTFSIASAPHEKELMIATRMRDTAFKRVLKGLPDGSAVELRAGPAGFFTLHANPARDAVFVAGGIGITPFRSMILDAAERRVPQRVLLFYSNHRPEDAAFLGELSDFERAHSRFRLVATMTNMQKSARPWGGETGRLNEMIMKPHLREVANPIYYIAGPPAMVAAAREMLVAIGANEDDIRSEEFAGY